MVADVVFFCHDRESPQDVVARRMDKTELGLETGGKLEDMIGKKS